MKKIALSLLLLICLCLGAAERKTTDVVVIIKVPAIRTAGTIDLVRPADITALRKESWNIYLPDSDKFLCIMTVAAENEQKILDAIRAHKTEDVEEITPTKEVVMQVLAPSFLSVKEKAEEAVAFAGETKAEFEARKQ